MTNTKQELTAIRDGAPDVTEFYSENSNGALVPLYQCKESGEWLYWTGFDWEPTDLEIGDVFIPASHIKHQIELMEQNEELENVSCE